MTSQFSSSSSFGAVARGAAPTAGIAPGLTPRPPRPQTPSAMSHAQHVAHAQDADAAARQMLTARELSVQPDCDLAAVIDVLSQAHEALNSCLTESSR